jgi:hypothetical protein
VTDAPDALRTWLEEAETAPETVAAVAFLATPRVDVADDELRAALRRALLVLAAGGDPHRDVDPDSPAVRSLAADLDSPHRRAQLAAALQQLEEWADGLPRVTGALDLLLDEPERAWAWYAAALLAVELGA